MCNACEMHTKTIIPTMDVPGSWKKHAASTELFDIFFPMSLLGEIICLPAIMVIHSVAKQKDILPEASYIKKLSLN